MLLRELMRSLGIAKDRRAAFQKLLDAMIRDGEIVEIKDNRYGLPGKMNLVTGRLQCHSDGFGFVIPEAAGEPDLFIGRRSMMEAMHGDSVVARIEATKPDGRREGRIIRVLKRGMTQIVGRFESGREFGFIVPTEKRIGRDLYVSPDLAGGAKDGDLVVADITSYPTPHRNPEGRIVQVLGQAGDPRAQRGPQHAAGRERQLGAQAMQAQRLERSAREDQQRKARQGNRDRPAIHERRAVEPPVSPSDDEKAQHGPPPGREPEKVEQQVRQPGPQPPARVLRSGHGRAVRPAGIALLIGEAFLPSFGVLGIGGAIALGLGSLLLFDTGNSDLGVDRSIIFTAVVTLSAFILLVGYLVFKSQKKKPTMGLEGLLGEIGEVKVTLNPSGKIFVHGEYWNAEGNEEIAVGTKVRVVGFEGMSLKVEKLSERHE